VKHTHTHTHTHKDTDNITHTTRQKHIHWEKHLQLQCGPISLDIKRLIIIDP